MSRFNILIVAHMAFRDDAGGPRVNLVLAREFRERGHVVDTFGIEDALPGARSRVTRAFAPSLFRAHALRYVRQRGRRYDVIQAEHGNLPASKKWLDFPGLLVAQSSGLVHPIDDVVKRYGYPSFRDRRGRFLGRVLAHVASAANNSIAAANLSFKHADLIVTLNQYEKAYVADVLGYPDKVVCRSNGLDDGQLHALCANRLAFSLKMKRPTAVSICRWDPVKGSRDWPKIVRQIRMRSPDFHLSLLGTGVDAGSILMDFDDRDREYISVTPRFEPRRLPDLLRDAVIGIFPSYSEGFGIGVLEMLAAGLPVVAYDNPGYRDFLRDVSPSSLVRAGQPQALAEEVLALVSREMNYIKLSEKAVRVACRFRWKEITETTLEEYARRMTVVRAGVTVNAPTVKEMTCARSIEP